MAAKEPGAAAIGYASVIERNWFALRQETIPVLQPVTTARCAIGAG